MKATKQLAIVVMFEEGTKQVEVIHKDTQLILPH